MGSVIKAVIPIAATVVAIYFGQVWALNAWQVAALAGAASIAASFAANAIFPTAISDFDLSFASSDLADRTKTIRQAISYRRTIYGTCRVGGVYTFIESTKDATGGEEGSSWLHMLVTVSSCQLTGFLKFYMNGEEETFDETTHVSTSGNYVDYMWCWTGDGTTSGDADLLTALQNACPSSIDSFFKQEGCGKVYLRLKYDSSIYSSGIPTPTFLVKGKPIYDTRTGTTAYSENSALVIRDALLNELGLGIDAASLPDTYWNAEANICDEDVTLADGGTEKRYTCNGSFDSDKTPKNILQNMLTSCAGHLLRSGGSWLLQVGSYRTPEYTITLDDLDGEIEVTSKVGRRDLCNCVKGTYYGEATEWEQSDFPQIVLDDYIEEDGNVILWKDVNYQFTVSATACQRIARIVIEECRRQITVNLKCKLTAYPIRIGDTIKLTLDRYGWDEKTFRVTSWNLVTREGGSAESDEDANFRLGIDLSLRETDSTVYQWLADYEGTITAPATTNLPKSTYVPKPKNLAISESLYITTNSSGVKAKATLSWEVTEPGYVYNYEIQYSYAGSGYKPAGYSTLTNIDILDIQPGAYIFRVRAHNAYSAASDWSILTTSLSGLVAAPSNVDNLFMSASGGLAILTWDQAQDLDVKIGGSVIIKHSTNAYATASWESARTLKSDIPGAATTASVPLLTGTYLAKFKDSSGVYSSNATSVKSSFALLNTLNAVETEDYQAGGFTGTKTNCEVNGSGYLEISDTSTSLTGTCELSTYIDLGSIYTVRASSLLDFSVYYEADLIDSRVELIDTWIDIDGDAIEGGDAVLYVATTDDDPSGSPTWSSWQLFTAGDYEARAYKFKVVLLVSETQQQIAILDLAVSLDMPDKTEKGNSLTIAAGGSNVTFSNTFYVAPELLTTIQDLASGDVVTISNKTATGFTWKVVNDVLGDVSRTGNYIAIGY